MLEKWYNKRLIPDYFSSDLRLVDWSRLKREGILCVLLDVDNTLARHGSRAADDYALAVIELLRRAEFRICVLSNGTSGRIAEYAGTLGVRHIGYARKPSPLKILDLLSEWKIEPEHCLIVGDQLLTDVLAARRAGCKVMLVEQRFSYEAINVKLKRKLERWLHRRYGNEVRSLQSDSRIAENCEEINTNDNL